ncbi:hypothetical protein P7H75_05735 [Vagococcus carniphilus]|uniref:hypothetical protein n=1 Tax=Vagococcus carniphilus TaxID=218144 RepID=UPI00288EC991|nr:hypothetical protein [Vagococcus carniphilus]MDT2814340.1 hypothetical protein [Vagococcus carniphilus]
MSKLLIDDHPIQVLPKLAKELGLNEAIFLQQLHYWLNSKSSKKINDRKWIYNTYEDWNKQFPFWSVATIKRIINSLAKKNLIIKGNFNRAGFDKTVWYSVNYEELEHVSQRLGQNDLTRGSNCTNGEGQNEPTNTIDYSETSTETTNNNKSPSKEAAKVSLKNRFEELWEHYPTGRKQGKEKAFNSYKKAIKDGVTDEIILNGLNAYKKQIEFQKTETQYIKQGSTWFNGKCWNDEYITSNNGSSNKPDYVFVPEEFRT